MGRIAERRVSEPSCFGLTVALFAAAAMMPAEARDSREPPSVEALLAVTPAVSGETPQWSPDGSGVLYVGGGRLRLARGADDIRTLDVDLGDAGHFLASQKPQFSPDGSAISYISEQSGSQELWLWSEDSGEARRLTNLGARINAYSWSPDGEWLAFSGDRHGAYDIWKVNVGSGAVYRLTAGSRYEVFPTWTPDGAYVLYVELDERWVDHDVYEVPADGGEARLVVRDSDFFDYQSGGRFGYPMVSPDGEYVLFRSHRSGWRNYWIVPRAGGEPRAVAPEPADQKGARWSPDGRHIAYTSLDNGTHRLRIAAVDGDTAPRTLVEPPGRVGVVASPDWSPDGAHLSFTMQTPAEPRDLHRVSVADGRVTRLTDSRPAPEVASHLLAPQKLMYPSTDGLSIPAYLYRPADAAADAPLPALVWIHGGPTSQFHDDFQAHVQFFAQRGFVVLMPNIRGSSGYGKDFEEANMGCWGRCDLEDVLAGVEYLRSLDFVDADNIGITGSSYGGIMSMAAPTFAPGVFQAAVPLSGYADYPHLMAEQELRHIKLLEYELGPLEEHRERYEYLSPINYVADITTPFLVINGRGRFPESEASDLFVAELVRHYKPVRHLVFDSENYYVRGRENRAVMLGEMLGFFRQHLVEHGIVTGESAGYRR